jgi:hypothetical protein
MHVQTWMLLLWAVVATALLLVMVYRATLTQHETDQLFLGDEKGPCASHEEHDRILARVSKIRPVCQGLTGITVLMTVLIAGLYVVELWPRVSATLR